MSSLTTAQRNKFRRLIKRWQKSPLQFVEEALKAEPTPQQREALIALAKPGAHVTIRSGHGTGKSTVFAWAILWHVICFDNSKCPVTAPTGHQLKDIIWAEISLWHALLPPALRDMLEIGTDRVAMRSKEKRRFAVARTARRETPDALQGFHAKNILFAIDEAPGVDEKVFEVAQGALSTPGARVIMAGNPTRVTGYFYESHQPDKSDRWTQLSFSCLDSPLVGKEYPLDVAQAYGEDSDTYRIRVLGEFPKGTIAQLFPIDLVNEAMKRKCGVTQYNFAPKILGVDVAWEGDDSSAIFLRQGIASELLGVYHQMNNMDLASMVIQFANERNVDAVFVDIGWGSGVIDRMRQLGYEPTPVNFGGSSSKERYQNKRTQMWCEMKLWLEDGGVMPEDHRLRQDLVGPQYEFRSNGRLILERKKDMKKRGLRSPDLGDALALTFAHPVAVLSDLEKFSGQTTGTGMCQTEYDLWK